MDRFITPITMTSIIRITGTTTRGVLCTVIEPIRAIVTVGYWFRFRA